MINAIDALEDTTTSSVNLSKTHCSKCDTTSCFSQSDSLNKSYSKNYVPKEAFFLNQKGSSKDDIIDKYKDNSIFS